MELLGRDGPIPPIPAAAMEGEGAAHDCPLDPPADPDPPSSSDPPPGPPELSFREHYERLLRELRTRAAEVTALLAQVPPAESVERFLSARTPEQRRGAEEDLLYAMVAAKVEIEQAADWLKRMMRVGA